jgi:adenosylcobinamide-GDP ribazoletransferase
MGRSTPYFPLVGLLVGLILVALDRLFSYVFPPLVVNSALFVSMVIITGGMHFDGLMDTCDGVFSGRDRERILEIMRDSRVGAFGVLGAVCLAAMKIALLNAVKGDIRWATLLVFPMLGRWGMVWGVTLFPYARKNPGIGQSFTDFARKRYILWSTIPVLAAAIPLFMWRGIALVITAGLGALLLGKIFSRKLGGLTGDTYGAICEITEVLVLMAVCVKYV